MKTTVELPDALLLCAKRYALAHGMTLKEVIEVGLRGVLADDRSRAPFRLKRRAFNGKGLAEGFDWPQIRDKVYQGRGA